MAAAHEPTEALFSALISSYCTVDFFFFFLKGRGWNFGGRTEAGTRVLSGAQVQIPPLTPEVETSLNLEPERRHGSE